MTKTIAIAGKGGTGKTTICALLIKLLAEKGVVLAIDGDPSSNLHLTLGLPLEDTVGAVREEMLAQVKGGSFSPGMAKQDYIDLRIHESLVESKGIDLLAMGRPEGPGCYCAANNMLRTVIDRMETNYDYVVIDNEAGMEHISRQTTRDVDLLLIISDVSMRGMITATRMKELIGEIRTSVGRVALIINRVDNGLPPEMEQAVSESGLELAGTIPTDPQALELDGRGVPLIQLPEDSPLMQAVREIAKRLALL
ncbi:MAG: AAA family ATPase [Dehalococcoidia bacterium]